jgi:DNA mismatch repair ATPase MutS
MRTKAGGGGREIVNRELAQVFTNGTIVDGTYLTSDEANHCVAIKVRTVLGDVMCQTLICLPGIRC